jgi:HEAT repeat protein
VVTANAHPLGERWGEVRIAVQQFRHIPMLVKASDDQEELRVPLPGRFREAVQQAASASPNMLLERRWLAQPPRYGGVKDVGEAVAAELDAAYAQSRLETLVQQAFQAGADAPEARSKPAPETLGRLLEHPDWKQRYAALEATGADPACLSPLLMAMQDPHVSVHRLATVLVGLVGTQEVMEPLCQALKDPAVAVRRSAGDALNDLGDPADPADPAALPAMAVALADPNKLVRWRAARFLFELGGREHLPTLAKAQDDPEFEVRMQVRQAMERIEAGQAAQGPVWARMTQKRSE